jgi:peptidyl-prolyl cis-trans isomerase D
LFAFTKDTDNDEKQLQKAVSARLELENKSFSDVASMHSDDKLTASKGGDLGLFNVGVMEKAFEDAASSLKLGEVSQPIKSSFGYHLIKVTELVKNQVKPFETVREELTVAYQKAQSETSFYELGETLTGLSFENPDSLMAVADGLGVEIKKTELFSRNTNFNKVAVDLKAITSELSIINAAFSEDVLKGNNSEPIELGSDRQIVLRMLEYKPAEVKPLKDVKEGIVALLLKKKSVEKATKTAQAIKTAIEAGQTMAAVAQQNGVEVNTYSGLLRVTRDVSWPVSQAVFKAAKPIDGKSTVVIVTEPSGGQAIINLLAVTEGVVKDSDKDKVQLLSANMASAFGQTDFDAVLYSLRKNADIKVKQPK